MGAYVYLGDCFLYSVNQNGQIVIWNLKDFKCRTFPDPIHQIDFNPASSWLIVAFTSHLIKLMDCISTRISMYSIPCPDGQTLKAIKVNPTNTNFVLLGYETDCVLWNFQEQVVQERYRLNDVSSLKTFLDSNSSQPTLTDLSWEPSGQDFAISYSDGTVVIWRMKKGLLQGLGIKKKKQVHFFKTAGLIRKMEWVQDSFDTTFLFISYEHIPRIIRLEIRKERYEKATGTIELSGIK